MNTLRFTLVSDGTTDAALIYPLRWLLVENRVQWPIEAAWADLRALPQPPTGLESRIVAAVNLYSCDLLFVHRDAEREPRERRLEEIRHAIRNVTSDLFSGRPYVCVIPVRMTEAWLLFDERAIRRAAGNPNGTVPLALPPVSKVEGLPDPKEILRELLLKATDKTARRLKNFAVGQAVHRLVELIEDFSPLRSAPAFSALEADLRDVIANSGWEKPVRYPSRDGNAA